MKTISQETSYASAHLLKEAQRRATQINELIGEMQELLDLNQPDDDTWTEIADVVFGFDTASNLFDRLEIQVCPHAENVLTYTAQEGWTKSLPQSNVQHMSV